MGKTGAFLEYEREIPEECLAENRIKNWQEFKLPFSEESARRQGARCMECGTPFCHSGLLLNGMVSGCPLNNLIPEWNDLIYRGLWKEALQRLLLSNNFPEFTSRVCPAPCEGACTLGMNDEPVSIKNNEYQIIERGFREGWIKAKPPANRSGEKIAIVGSGPSGLAAADQLNKAGHTVVVYEKEDRIGGLLMYGIPNMKLSKEKVVQRRIDIMRDEGIMFINNMEVGKDIPGKSLQREFDAVLLCGGAGKTRDLEIEGREAKGIYFALDFLTANTKNLLNPGYKLNPHLSAKNKDVIIIGGGDTGTDCLATSIRQGAKSVVQLEIMPEPPQNRLANNQWPEYPRTLKVDYGQEEAIAVYGKDPREYQTMSKRFVADKDGKIKELHTVKVRWEKSSNSKYKPVEIRGSEKVWPAQLVLLAMGFVGTEDTLIKEFTLNQDASSNVKVEYGDFKTNVEGVFAAGDMRRGQSLVAWAIKEGRQAAEEINRYLMD